MASRAHERTVDRARRSASRARRPTARSTPTPQAAIDFEAALRSDPRHADAYFELANARYGLRDVAGAATAYRDAIGLRPTHAMAYANLGNARAELGQSSRALAAYRRGLQAHARLLSRTICHVGTA